MLTNMGKEKENSARAYMTTSANSNLTVIDAKHAHLFGLGEFSEFIQSPHQIKIFLTLGISEKWQRARKRVLILPV